MMFIPRHWGWLLSFQKTNVIFQHFGWLFLPGTLKKIPCCLNELLVNFREESINSGIGRFCRKFQQIANWPIFDFLIETGWIARNRAPISYNSPSFDFFNRNWASWPSVEIRACKIGLSHQISLEHWPIAHWGSRERFLTSEGEKACQSVEKSCFFFLER